MVNQTPINNSSSSNSKRKFNATYYYAKNHSNYNVPTQQEYELHKLLSNPNRGFLDVIMSVSPNDIVQGNVAKCWNKINQSRYERGRICCSISGGSDSDVLLDMTRRCDPERKIYYYFIDTGLESAYTKAHLDYLQLKYQVKIHRFKAKTPIPLAISQNGIPFLSKQVSEFIMRLQNYGFEFDDTDDLEFLLEKYCKKADNETKADIIKKIQANKKVKWFEFNGEYYKGCCAALKWWCCAWGDENRKSKFDITYNKYLKEFLIQENGVPFKVANKCCKLSKKDTIHQVTEMLDPQLSIQGVRKAEGGARSSAYKSCYNDASSHPYDEYRPLFWFLDKDKKDYVEYCGIKHSKLYDYMKRSGCLGCPFGQDNAVELNYAAECEPQMYKAMKFIFGPSYEFERKYHEFQKKMNLKEATAKKLLELQNCEFTQMSIFDFAS